LWAPSRRTLRFSLDHLVETREGNSSSEIIAALFELALSGLVRQRFLKVWATDPDQIHSC
jgi:hypothetical protein